MSFKAGTSTRASVQVGIKLARLLELPEEDFAGRVRELEADVLFRRLIHAKVISVQPYSGAGFLTRRFGGWGLSTASDGIPAALDGQGDLAKLLQRVGEKRFEEYFLRDEGYTDDERARLCRISKEEAGRLRELVNSLYIQAEFDGSSSTSAPAKTYSAVAGITAEGGKPALGFFNRQIWKGRYQVDEDKSRKMLDALPPGEARRLEGFLRELGLLDRRKSTLFRVLEALIEAQAAFLASGEPGRRRALTQRELADKLDVTPSVLNRLISNKSVQLPWGLEAPMKTLLPSRKSLIRDHLHDLVLKHPQATDEELSRKIDRLYGAALSSRSIAQYRSELGLGNLRQRRRASA
jgi:RNA polymerase sigma-54 factor